MYFFEQAVYDGDFKNIKQNNQPNIPVENEENEENLDYENNLDDENIDPQEQKSPKSLDDILNNPASISIKRYFLIKKLFSLNEKLNRLNMENDVLNFLINFIDSFSYGALLAITRKLVEEIYIQLKTPDQADPISN